MGFDTDFLLIWVARLLHRRASPKQQHTQDKCFTRQRRFYLITSSQIRLHFSFIRPEENHLLIILFKGDRRYQSFQFICLIEQRIVLLLRTREDQRLTITRVSTWRFTSMRPLDKSSRSTTKPRTILSDCWPCEEKKLVPQNATVQNKCFQFLFGRLTEEFDQWVVWQWTEDLPVHFFLRTSRQLKQITVDRLAAPSRKICSWDRCHLEGNVLGPTRKIICPSFSINWIRVAFRKRPTHWLVIFLDFNKLLTFETQISRCRFDIHRYVGKVSIE